jgi:wobble nucleotide-excising tRNase
MVSSEPTIERVNRLLKSVGFTNFHVARSTATPDGYSLKRSDGSVVEDTLSDGERTFIAFLYYFAQLESRDLAAESEELVAVIDDPISSLDSDLLFIVSTLVRRLLVTIHTGTGRLKQAVVLTHNLEFYLELTYERELDRQQGLLAGRKYFELRRSADGVNEVRYSETNTIKSTHQRLWDEVRRASAESGPVDKGLETVMRRILEDHFTALGRVPNFSTLADDFSGDEAIAYRSLFSWLHHGSHTLIDELDYEQSGISRELFLRVFRRIFEQTGQIGHYDTMMGVDDPSAEVNDVD